MPWLRRICATGTPASPSFRIATICDSLNLLLFIGLPSTENPARKVHFQPVYRAGELTSTLAGWLARELDLSTLDLDSVAWEPTQPPMQRPDTLAGAEVAAFCSRHP